MLIIRHFTGTMSSAGRWPFVSHQPSGVTARPMKPRTEVIVR